MPFRSRPVIFVVSLIAVLILFFHGSANAADEADKSDIIGNWNLDADALRKLIDEQVAAEKMENGEAALIKQVMSTMKMSFEFKADGTFVATLENTGAPIKQSKQGSWSVIAAKDNTLTLSTKVDDKSDEVMVTIGMDTIVIHLPKNEKTPFDRLPLKRAKD